MEPIDEQVMHRRRGWWIRVARERLGITIEALAAACGYTDGKGTVSLWEKGKRPVPSGKFPTIARVLELPARYLVNPPETDEERLDRVVRDASELERLDAESGLGQDPPVVDEPGGERGRRSA